MSRTVTATEAKNQFASLISNVKKNDEPIFIENRGKPQAVLLSENRYRALETIEREQRRADTLRRLRAIQAEGEARNSDLTEDEAMELAVQAVKEIRAEMASEERAKRSQGPT